MAKTDSPVEVAERHVAEAERRIARHRKLIETLERDKHINMLPHARRILELLEESLRLARVHLQLERDHYGNPSKDG